MDDLPRAPWDETDFSFENLKAFSAKYDLFTFCL